MRGTYNMHGLELRALAVDSALALKAALGLGFAELSALNVEDVTEVWSPGRAACRVFITLPSHTHVLEGEAADLLVRWLQRGPRGGRLFRSVTPEGRLGKRLSTTWLRARIMELAVH
jgi:hypothetical protein